MAKTYPKKSHARQGFHDLTENFLITKWDCRKKKKSSCDSPVLPKKRRPKMVPDGVVLSLRVCIVQFYHERKIIRNYPNFSVSVAERAGYAYNSKELFVKEHRQ